MELANFAEQASAYRSILEAWWKDAGMLPMSELDPDATALVSVDVIEGFTRLGPLASPRVTGIIDNVADLVRKLSAHGVPPSHIAFVQDAHPEDAQEFRSYPPHCVRGGDQAEAAHELQALPGWASYRHFEKNSIASHTSEAFNRWLASLEVESIIAVGDVTDLCLYTLALHLQVRNQAEGMNQRIIVPENCVQTWDAPDHPGDFYHAVFLHQLARNGVQVVEKIA